MIHLLHLNYSFPLVWKHSGAGLFPSDMYCEPFLKSKYNNVHWIILWYLEYAVLDSEKYPLSFKSFVLKLCFFQFIFKNTGWDTLDNMLMLRVCTDGICILFIDSVTSLWWNSCVESKFLFIYFILIYIMKHFWSRKRRSYIGWFACIWATCRWFLGSINWPVYFI